MESKGVKHITGFYFGYARYRLEDGQGDVVLLEIDYQNNKFKIVPKSRLVNHKFRREAGKVAINLLGKKHGNNFVDRLLKKQE